MHIIVNRTKFFKTHTIGQMYIDGEFFCFTLEDVVREVPGVPVQEWKIKHETAIPTGEYKVLLVNSRKFGKDSPWLQDVPGFTEILIHGGVNASHTSGCILVGFHLDSRDLIVPSSTQAAKNTLKIKVREAVDRGEEITIEINGLPK